jgi:hypothetical protein
VTRRTPAAVIVALSLLALPACVSGGSVAPECGDPGDRTMVLVAQTVPSAPQLPCVEALPPGWTVSGSNFVDGSTTFWLDLPVAGIHAVEVKLTETCDTSDASQVVPAPDEAGAEVFVAPTSLDPFQSVRRIVYDGGCVTYRYRFAGGAPAAVSLEVDAALSFMARQDVVDDVWATSGERLCGAGAPPCEDRR